MTITDVENMIHANDSLEEIDQEEIDEATEEIGLDESDEELLQ